MVRSPTETDRAGLYRQGIEAALRRLRRPQARVKAARAGSAAVNAMASFGMIVSLLIMWAMAANM